MHVGGAPLPVVTTPFARLAMPIARSTMNHLLRRAGQKGRLREPVLAARSADSVLNVDETSFSLSQQKAKALMWAFVGQSLTGRTFATSRGGDVPVAVLDDSQGVLVGDDYCGDDLAATKGARLRAGCFGHTRRKLLEAGDVPEARDALALIGAMYAVEHEAEGRGVLGTYSSPTSFLIDGKPPPKPADEGAALFDA